MSALTDPKDLPEVANHSSVSRIDVAGQCLSFMCLLHYVDDIQELDQLIKLHGSTLSLMRLELTGAS